MKVVNFDCFVVQPSPTITPEPDITRRPDPNVVNPLFRRITAGESFLDVVCPVFIAYDMSRADVRQIIRLTGYLDSIDSKPRGILDHLNISPERTHEFLEFVYTYDLYAQPLTH